MNPRDLSSFLNKNIVPLGLTHWGWTPIKTPNHIDAYRTWLDHGSHGDMTYLENHFEVKNSPHLKWPWARTVLVFAAHYPSLNQTTNNDDPSGVGPVDASSDDSVQPAFPFSNLRISKYAQGPDYHLWFQDRLHELIKDLIKRYPNEKFEATVDTSPLMERDFAASSGLGWVGKNTCIIHPKKGSMFFLGEILTSLDFESLNSILTAEPDSGNIQNSSFTPKPLPDFCGTCTRCIDICPTQAITEPHVMNAQKCISYLTIESKTVAPPNLRPLIGDWFFGCDLCQTVCPWNQKILKQHFSEQSIREHNKSFLDLKPEEKTSIVEDLRYILVTSNKELERKTKGTAMSRIRGWQMKRNALYLIANQNFRELSPEILELLKIERRKNDPRPTENAGHLKANPSKLVELIIWTLNTLN